MKYHLIKQIGFRLFGVLKNIILSSNKIFICALHLEKMSVHKSLIFLCTYNRSSVFFPFPQSPPDSDRMHSVRARSALTRGPGPALEIGNSVHRCHLCRILSSINLTVRQNILCKIKYQLFKKFSIDMSDKNNKCLYSTTIIFK